MSTGESGHISVFQGRPIISLVFLIGTPLILATVVGILVMLAYNGERSVQQANPPSTTQIQILPVPVPAQSRPVWEYSSRSGGLDDSDAPPPSAPDGDYSFDEGREWTSVTAPHLDEAEFTCNVDASLSDKLRAEDAFLALKGGSSSDSLADVRRIKNGVYRAHVISVHIVPFLQRSEELQLAEAVVDQVEDLRAKADAYSSIALILAARGGDSKAAADVLIKAGKALSDAQSSDYPPAPPAGDGPNPFNETAPPSAPTESDPRRSTGVQTTDPSTKDQEQSSHWHPVLQKALAWAGAALVAAFAAAAKPLWEAEAKLWWVTIPTHHPLRGRALDLD